jgi:predicted phage terminase large subunit-like protein
MNYSKTASEILKHVKKDPFDDQPRQDYFELCRAWFAEWEAASRKKMFHQYQITGATNKVGRYTEFNHPAQLHNRKDFRPLLTTALQRAVENRDWAAAERLDSMLFKSLLFGAPHFFEDYLNAVEYGKPYDKRFYAPRQHYLHRYTQAYQEVLEGKLHFLSVSMPKRAGKSQLGINFVNMLSGRKPNHSTLMEGTGDDLVQSFYKGCLEYLDAESEYHFYDIFPSAKLVQTYADRKTFNLDKKSRFPTVMCRSIDARQVGLSEATNLLYLDDCVEGREEAKNRQRLDDKWEVISGDIIGRAIEGTPIVICGTRYSLYDPIGRLQETARKSGWKWKAIETPALDPVTDETNFEYMRDGKPVFTTAFFREQREILCAEQWESEFQQQPFEAKGLLFNKDELNYFFELPVGREPDTIFAACDTADKGADFTSMPIVAIYDQEAYLIDVVFDDAPPTVTKPECAKTLRDNHVASAVFESNNAGSYFARDVEQLLKGMGYTCSIRTKRTISNKETRIEFASDNIIKKFYFRHPSTYKAGSQYDQFFKQLTTYVRQGKVPHDDAPDSLAMLENEIRMRIGSQIEVVNRTF